MEHYPNVQELLIYMVNLANAPTHRDAANNAIVLGPTAAHGAMDAIKAGEINLDLVSQTHTRPTMNLCTQAW